MNSFFLLLLLLAYLALFIWGIKLARKFGWFTLANVILIVLFALIYDQTVLAVGRWLGEGNRLEQLNELRFWFHALCTPLLVIFCWHALVRANIALFQKRKMMGFAWGLTIFLIGYQLITEVFDLDLIPQREQDLLFYENSAKSPIPVMIIIVTIVILICAFFLYKKSKWPWLLVATIIMIAGHMLSLWLKNTPLTNSFEWILMFGLVATKRFQDFL